MTTIKPTGNYVHLKVTSPKGKIKLNAGVLDPNATFTVLAIGPLVPEPITIGVEVKLRDKANLCPVDKGNTENLISLASEDEQEEDVSVIVDCGSILYVK